MFPSSLLKWLSFSFSFSSSTDSILTKKKLQGGGNINSAKEKYEILLELEKVDFSYHSFMFMIRKSI
jgi:hypothetical protein